MVSIFDHFRLRPWIAAAALIGGYAWGGAPPSTPATPAASAAHSPSRTNDFPTYARVQFVQECMLRHGGSEADVYKCSCVIDHIAAHLSYDKYVEVSTYAHYSSLGGENAGIFRDHPLAQQSAKLYRALEAAAYHSCGLKPPAG